MIGRLATLLLLLSSPIEMYSNASMMGRLAMLLLLLFLFVSMEATPEIESPELVVGIPTSVNEISESSLLFSLSLIIWWCLSQERKAFDRHKRGGYRLRFLKSANKHGVALLVYRYEQLIGFKRA
jgi:hypothetical protein